MSQIVVFFSKKGENYVSGSIQDLTVGNTERVAENISSINGSELFELEMVNPYSNSYNDCIEEAKNDKQKNVYPPLKAMPESIDEYDTIFLGYPNYWGTMPMAVFTFLNTFDFTGKKIKPFCTHEGSGLGNSVKDIQRMCPTAIVEKGLAVHGSRIDASRDEIEAWAQE